MWPHASVSTLAYIRRVRQGRASETNYKKFNQNSLRLQRYTQSGVKRGQTSRPRPRPELQGRGQFLEAEAKAEAKNNYEKVPNND